MADDNKQGRRALPRLIPLAISLVLGVSIATLLSGSTSAWARGSALDGDVPIIQGTVHLQGRPSPPSAPWSVPLVVTLYEVGSTTPAFTYTPTTDQSGHFTITHSEEGAHAYDIRVKNAHTLRNIDANVTLQVGDNFIDFGTLREGDANDDNYVGLIDFSILATSYDKSSAQPGFDARADFNENDLIEISDFSLLATNYDRSGDIAVASFGQAAAKSRSNEAMALTLQPPYGAIQRDQVFTIDVRLDPKGQPFQGVATYLKYDPQELEIVDANGNPTSEIIAGSALPVVLQNEVDAAAGEIRFSAGSLGTTSGVPQGEFVVATLRFRALDVNVFGSHVTFLVSEDPPRTGVAYDGNYVPLQIGNLTLRIGARRLLHPNIED
jgi:hypothetical protein